MANHLFVYGTLRKSGQMRGLIGRVPNNSFLARLTGYRRHKTGYGFPVALPDPEATIDGVLWADLTDDEIRRLDIYEGGLGNMYDRIEVQVECVAGETKRAWFYVGNAAAWAVSEKGMACPSA